MFKNLISQSEFSAWLAKAQPGQPIIYGTGSYCSKANGVKYEAADAAYKAHQNRQVLLFQRRMGGGVYEYIAVKAPINFRQLDKEK